MYLFIVHNPNNVLMQFGFAATFISHISVPYISHQKC